MAICMYWCKKTARKRWGFMFFCMLFPGMTAVVVLDKEIIDEFWYHYKVFFNKKYDVATEISRKTAFIERLRYIIVENLAHDLTGHWYQAGLNSASDFTKDDINCGEEMGHKSVGSRTFEAIPYDEESLHTEETPNTNNLNISHELPISQGIGVEKRMKEIVRMQTDNRDVGPFSCFCKKKRCPTTLNWIAEGRVDDVGDQKCSDCYAWAATYALSSRSAIINISSPLGLSVQEAKDCSYNVTYIKPGHYFNMGCDKGNPYFVYKGLKDHTGYTMTNATNYLQYNDKNGTLTCNVAMAKKKVAVKLKQHDFMHANDSLDDCTLEKLLIDGPVVASMCLSKKLRSWKTNKNQIYKDWNCYKDCQQDYNKTDANHFVLLAGYTPDAWIIQSSHGNSWGYKGTAYLARNKSPGLQPRICNLGYELHWPSVEP